MHRFSIILMSLWLTLFNGGCSAPVVPTLGGDPQASSAMAWATTPAPKLQLPAGYKATLVMEGLDNPTQFAVSEDGWIWTVQLAGGETSGTGQLVALSIATGEHRVLAEDLFKPTGLALLDGQVWLMAGSELWHAPITGAGAIGTLEKVTELPSTSRSSGTLTTLPNGRLLYVTSGPDDDDLSLGEGRLWTIDPKNPTEPENIGVGFAMPYAHVLDENQQLWVVNMTEDIIAGEVPPDALFKVDMTSTAEGVPCYYYYDLADEYPDGKAPAFCESANGPVLFFPPHSTPTGIVVSPWEPNTLLVSFWIAGEVVRVPLGTTDGTLTATWEPFISGMVNAHHMVVLKDGTLLVNDFGQGKIYRIEKQ
jgi:glucose/arabinose dehydrogenase